MLWGNTSAISIWTLAIAAIAAISSIGGVIWHAKFSERSETEVWQRNLRVQVYGALASEAEIFSTMTTAYPPTSRSQLMDQIQVLSSRLSDVTTFGATEVSDRGFVMLKAFAVLALSANPSDRIDSAERSTATSAFSDYRKAIRRSLGITDR